jgi:hypothetical protein
MNFKRTGKKALKEYAGLKVFSGLTKWVALAVASLAAFRFFQGRRSTA